MSPSKSLARIRAATIHGSRDIKHETVEAREACVKKDLTRRMKNICANLSKVDFEALVTDMTREQLRGERVCGNRLQPC